MIGWVLKGVERRSAKRGVGRKLRGGGEEERRRCGVARRQAGTKSASFSNLLCFCEISEFGVWEIGKRPSE